MKLPYPQEWSPRQRRQKILLDGPLTPRWLPQVEGLRCGVAEVFPWQTYQGSISPETPSFNKKVSTANGAGISNQRGPAHNTNNFVPNEYREVVNPSGLVVYKGSNASDSSDR